MRQSVFLLPLLLIVSCLSAYAQPPNLPGHQGTIRQIFDCSTGVCTSLTLADGELIDMSAVSVTSTSEGLLLPLHATDCSSATAEGQVCWDVDSDELHVGTSSGTITVGDAAGGGDVSAVFNCTSGDCASISLADNTDLLDMSSVSVTTTTEGLILPQHATDCSAATAEGQVCWQVDTDVLWIGDGGTAVSLGGDITDVFNCSSGNCASVALADTDLLDMSSVSVTTTTEGLILPQHATDCSAATAEGQVCWEADDDSLYIGDGAAANTFAGDITSVYSCTSGACTSVALSDGDFLDMSGVAPSSTTEGLKLPQGSDCTSQVSDGLLCWDNDNDVLYVGNGTSAVPAGSGDITNVFDCASGDCASVSLSDGDLLDMTNVSVTTTTEGLILPQHATDCSAATAEGQVCWEADDNALFIGDGATAITFAGDITDVFNCASGDCNSVALADGDLLDMSSVSITSTSEGLILPQHATDCSSSTAEGQACWNASENRLYIGDGATTFEVGDVLSVFDCASGACTSLTLSDMDLIDMSSVSVTTTTEGLILPQHATDCSSATAEGQVCWEADDNRLYIGDNSGQFQPGDILAIFDCLSGTCTDIALADTQLIDMSSVSVTTTTEGLILPQHATNCSSATAEGQVCWNASTDLLSVGDGTAIVTIPLGDITSVFDCTSGACAALTLSDGDGIDMSSVNPNSAGEGIILPQVTDCTSSTVEGQMCWDTDSDELHIGTSASTITIGDAAGGGDIGAVFNCTSGDCASISLADNTDLLDMSSVSVTTTTEGLILPQHATDCSAATAEGQVCWQVDTDTLYVGDGTSVVDVSQAAITLDQAFDNGKVIDGANSQANAFTAGDGTDGIRIYVGASGPTIECFQGASTCDYIVNVASGNSFIINLDGTDSLTISDTGIVTLGTLLQEVHTTPIPAGMMVADGTLCVKGTDVTLNAEVFNATITCADNDGSNVRFNFPAPASWDEATMTIDTTMFKAGANADAAYHWDWVGYCAGDNDPFGHNTYPAEDANSATDIDASGYAVNDLMVASTAGNVPLGACAEGDMVSLRGSVDSTGTLATDATLVHILWASVKLTYNTWSD